MFFFGRKKQQRKEALKEAEIQATRRDMFNKVDKATEQTDKAIKLFEDEELGIAGKIFYATGGDKRQDND